MSIQSTIQAIYGYLQEAESLLQNQNKHRVEVFDQWYGSTTDYYIDNIRLEASSGMVVGFSGGQRVFSLTLEQFSKYSVCGRVDTYYTVEHCSIRKSYTRRD